MDLARNTIPQNLVLFLREFNISGKFIACDGGDQSQQWVENQ